MTRVQSIVVFSVAVAFMLAGSPLIAPHSGNQAEARHQPSMAADLSPVPAATSPHLASPKIQFAARSSNKLAAKKHVDPKTASRPSKRLKCNPTPTDNPKFESNNC
jgi:hypothetical protein